jgi:hypothetical protein
MVAVIEKSKDGFIVKLYNGAGLVEKCEVSNGDLLKKGNYVIGMRNLIVVVKN